MKLRLHQFLSKTGVFTSKAEAKQAIWDGEITVNGSVVKNMTFQFNVNTKEVTYKGKVLELHDDESHFLLHKPAGCICSRLNSHERSLGKISVYETFREHVDATTYERLVTVGRLDENTTGFLLVTTDGKMVHRITSPDHTVRKTYEVQTAHALDDDQLDAIRNGVRIVVDDGEASDTYWTKPAEVQQQSERSVMLTIGEGKKRQIRRMFGALNNPVVELHRHSTEAMELKDYELQPGEFVAVKRKELVDLILNPSV
jgi:pseudouridine synthase